MLFIRFAKALPMNGDLNSQGFPSAGNAHVLKDCVTSNVKFV